VEPSLITWTAGRSQRKHEVSDLFTMPVAGSCSSSVILSGRPSSLRQGCRIWEFPFCCIRTAKTMEARSGAAKGRVLVGGGFEELGMDFSVILL